MAESASSSSETTTASPSSTVSTSFTPTGTRDTAPGSPGNQENNDDSKNPPSGMASYYFVFLMLSLCVIGIVVFLNLRRRRKRRLQLLYGRGGPSQQDYATAGGRRFWPRGWGSANVSREEGLNEHGEAPPPYMPKSTAQDVQERSADSVGGQQSTGETVSFPLQTLSRDDAGMRPPAYYEAGASSSQSPEVRQS